MFIGHVAAALAGKRAAPRTSLGTLLGAAIFLDLVWPILLLLNVEQVRIDPGNTAFTPLDFVHYPISHSLLTALGFSLAAGVIYHALSKYAYGAWTVGVLVLSHWILDWLTHRPDLPLWPGGPTVGLGMWHSVPLTLAVEILVFTIGVVIYLGTTHARNGTGRWAFGGLMAFYVAVYFANAFGPPPANVRDVAWITMLMWIFPLWAWWADRNRAVTPQTPETAFGAVDHPVTA